VPCVLPINCKAVLLRIIAVKLAVFRDRWPRGISPHRPTGKILSHTIEHPVTLWGLFYTAFFVWSTVCVYGLNNVRPCDEKKLVKSRYFLDPGSRRSRKKDHGGLDC